MNLKEKLAEQKSKTWLVFTPPPQDFKFSELVSLADWYNNQVLLKAFKSKKMSFKLGEKTLLSSPCLLPAERLVVVGLGDSDGSKTDIQKLMNLTEETLQGLATEDVWFVISKDAPQEFISNFEKKHSNVLVG